MLRVLRHRESALLIAGQAVSSFGDGIANVALPLMIISTTHSATKLGLFAAARTLPMVLLMLFGGVIVDRFSRRQLLLISDTCRAIFVGVVATLELSHHLHFWHLLVFALLFGAFDAVFMPAMTALTPEIVPDELFGSMNALRGLSAGVVGGMLGPAVGGVLTIWNPGGTLAIDAVTFVVSAIALAMMRATSRPESSTTSTMLTEIREGLRYTMRTPWIWIILLSAGLSNALVFSPVSVLTPYFLKHDLGASARIVGLSFACAGAAGGLGSLIVGSLPSPRRRIRAMSLAWLVSMLAALIICVAHAPWEVFLVGIISAPLLVYGNVIWESLLQSEVPRELLGRISSVDWFVSLGLTPLGIMFASELTATIGLRHYVLVAVLVCVIPSVMALRSKPANAIDAGRVVSK
jgi:hypothetical protein